MVNLFNDPGVTPEWHQRTGNRMAELAPNYNIQCMKLFQELKSAFPCIPDMVVRQCMKQHCNDLDKCKEELSSESQHGQNRRYKALLSHQMEQLLKLKNELAEGRREVDGIKGDVRLMEQEIKAQELMIRGQPSKMVQVEVKQLEVDIGQLRGACDQMSKKVTHLTQGKVPLGETSINFENYLAANQTSVPDPLSASGALGVVTNPGPAPPGESTEGGHKWACSECTFSNHPSLQSCEICEMPRFELG